MRTCICRARTGEEHIHGCPCAKTVHIEPELLPAPGKDTPEAIKTVDECLEKIDQQRKLLRELRVRLAYRKTWNVK